MGNPGSGKTTTGRIVAKSLRKDLVDIDDHHLEPTWGMSVADKVKVVEMSNIEVMTLKKEIKVF